MIVYKISWLMFFLSICTGNSEADIAPNLYCNNEKQTWIDAWNKCINAQGIPVVYDTGIGLTIKDIHLHSEADVWTSDYASLSPTSQNQLCGFNFLSNDTLSSPIMYGDCDVQRYYLCKNNTTNRLEVQRSKREEVKCPETISFNDLKNLAQDIKPGYYWTFGIKNVSIDMVKGFPLTWPFLCGAYSADKDKFFDDCAILKSSLCNISNYTIQHKNFNKSCFVNDIAESTMKPVHIGTSTTKKTVTANKTTIAKNQKENDSNLGVSVGVPVGLGVAMLCGILLVIFILRRYKCSKSGSAEEVSQKQLPSPKPENVSVNKSYELSFVRFLKGKKTSDKPNKKGDQPLQNSVPEYAVVRKTNPKPLSQVQNKNPNPEEKTHEHVQDSVCDENISFCYTRAEHKKGVNSTSNQKSEYSFAEEMAGDIENNGEDQLNDAEEDYDVTCNIKHFHTQNNTYNTLQMEEYGSFHNQRRGDNTYNILNMPNDQDPQNDYDTANQRDHNVGTNSIYNSLR